MPEAHESSLFDTGDDIIRLFVSNASQTKPQAGSYGCVLTWRTLVKEMHGYAPGATRRASILIGAREAFGGILNKTKDVLLFPTDSYTNKVIKGKWRSEAHSDLVAEVRDRFRTIKGQVTFIDPKDQLCSQQEPFLLRAKELANIALKEKLIEQVLTSYQRNQWFTRALSKPITPAIPPREEVKEEHPPHAPTVESVTTVPKYSRMAAAAKLRSFFYGDMGLSLPYESCALFIHLSSLNFQSIEQHEKMLKLLGAYIGEEGMSVSVGFAKPWPTSKKYQTKRNLTIQEYYQNIGFISLSKGGIIGNVSYIVRTNPGVKDIMLVGNTDLAFADIVTSDLINNARFYLACDDPDRMRVKENFTTIINLGFLMKRT